MDRFLLLVSFFLTASITLCLGQSDPLLGRATTFSVLAATQVKVTGPETTGVDGNLGISPGKTIVGENFLFVSGKKHKGTELAAEAQRNAREAYTTLRSMPATGTLGPNLGNGQTVKPGVYRINGDASLNGIMVLDGEGNINSTFVFIIEGSFTTFPPTAQNPTPSMISQQGAEAKNVYWVVEDEVDMGSSTSFVGNIIAQNDITLDRGSRIQGRAISLTKAVNFHFNTVFLPIVVYSNLSVEKTAQGGDFSVGAEVTYTITATNRGPGAAIGVEVKEKVPAGLEFIRADAAEGTYDPATNIWKIGDMSNGQSITLTIVFRVLKPGVLRNQVEIDGDNPDPDEDDNIAEKPIEVTCPALNPVISGNAVLCANSKEVVFSVTEVVGAKYVFTLPQGWTKLEQTGNTIKVNVGTASGKIRATVTDQCGTSAAAELDIAVTGAPAVGTIEGAASLCFNSPGVTYAATGVSGEVAFAWLVTEGLEIVSGQGTAEVVVKPKAGATGGTLTLKVTNSCSFETVKTKVITVTPAPIAPAAIAGSATLCVGTEATYTATVVPGATYTWTVPEGWAIVSENATTNQIRVRAGATGGNITVVSNNVCSSSSVTSLAVAVIETPAAPTAITGEATPCAGTEHTYRVEPVNGATSYVWDIPTGWTVVGSRTSSTIRIVVGSAEGTLKAAAVNACGTSAQASLTITPNNIPARPGAITSPAIVCSVSQGNVYSIAAVPGATTYTWAVPTGWEITAGQGTTSITVSNNATSGTVRVKASNVCGSSEERTATISLSTIPAAPVAISGMNDLCAGVVETYSVAALAGVTYNWTVPATGGWEIVEGQGTAQVRVKIGTASGSVGVSASNACGTSSNASRAVAVTNVLPAPAAITGTAAACIGTELTYTIDAVTGATGYTWSVPAGWTVIGSTTGTSIRVRVGAGAGDIKVAVTNRCGAGAQASLAVAPTLAPEAPGAITNVTDVCIISEGNVLSVAAVPGATSYNWTVPAGWVITGGQGTASITVTATATGGAVSVTASNACGTSPASTRNITITIPPAGVGRITDNSNVCDGLTFTADAVEGATSYTWTVSPGFTVVSGQGTPTVTVKADSPKATGQISVVANNGDCAGSVEASAPMDAALADGQLDFPKAFSPNGDGKNDTWVISNLLKFPDNEVVIFNRWGSEVYKQRGYKNDWAAQGLQQGTYFYKVRVKLCDGVYKESTGYVAIFR